MPVKVIVNPARRRTTPGAVEDSSVESFGSVEIIHRQGKMKGGTWHGYSLVSVKLRRSGAEQIIPEPPPQTKSNLA
jgi:hypothetical protein